MMQQINYVSVRERNGLLYWFSLKLQNYFFLWGQKYAEKVKLQNPIFKTIRYLSKGTTCRKSEIFTDITHCNRLSKTPAAPFILVDL